MLKNKTGQIWTVCYYNFRLWKRNPRIILTFCLAFIVSFLLSDQAAGYGDRYGTVMQAFEPFIWTFGDGTAIMIASTLLLLLFADMPHIHAGTPSFLLRTTRKCWIAGQILYIVLATTLFTGFICGATTLLCMKRTFIGNVWSETAAMLAYSGVGKKLALPAAVRTMERSTPYGCALQVFLLLLLYCLSMVLLMLAINLHWNRKAGMGFGILYGLTGLLLNPEVLQAILGEETAAWQINVFLGWASPLNHATYSMHNFGYDRLPTLSQTWLFFMGIILLVFLLVVRLVRHYNFHFTGR